MFLNAVMLAGIAGAALPLIVHLLSRARVRTVDWGAMMFLDEGRGTQEHMAKLKQWTLLVLRMAIVALLAIAMARPIASANWAGPTGPLTAVIIIDCSASMAQPTTGGRTRADLAREAVLRILSNFRKGDRAALVLAGARREVVSPTPDLQSVATRVAEVKPSSAAADMTAALNEAASVIERSSAANARLYLVTDAQASNWHGVDSSFQSAWRRRTTRAGRPLLFDVVSVDVGRNVDNVAIESVTVAPFPMIAGVSSEIEVKLRDFSPAPRSSMPLTVRTAKEVVFSGTVEPLSGAAAAVTVPVRFDAPGQQTLVTEITSSGTLAFDDRLQHVVDVVAPLRVLIISGDERSGVAGTFRSESDFLRTALTPYATMKRPGVDPAKVTVIPVEGWTEPSVSADTDVLVIANVAELTPQQVRAVESFTYAGGGVLVAPGATTRADSYNRSLFRDGTGLLPASLVGPSADQPTSLLGIDLAHPIFRFLRGRPAPIPAAVVARMFNATPRPGAAVLASYVTGQPFLIEGAYGRGRVLLMTTTIDADWNTLPLSSFYLPFVQSATRYLASAALLQRNLAPGQELRARFADAPEQMRAALTLPGGRTMILEVNATGGGGYEVVYADASEPGLYSLRAKVGGQERVQQFAVHPDLGESDLKPLDEAQWSKLQQSLAFRRVSAGARTSVTASAQPVRELWLPLLLGAFSLVAIELMLTRFWSEGRHE